MPDDCAENTDPLKLVREGTSQDGRLSAALEPAYAPVSEHAVKHGIVFAQSYAALLKYFNDQDVEAGDWTPLFGTDVSVPLAVAAIEDVESYKSNTLAWFDYLNAIENKNKTAELRNRLGYLYASIGTLATALDGLKDALPRDHALAATLQNLIRTQLAPAFERLIAYHKGGTPGLINPVAPPGVQILRHPVVSFASILTDGLSQDWSKGAAWAGHVAGIAPEPSVYGNPAASVFAQINHCTTHNLFRSIFDQFLRVFARIVADAEKALDDTLTRWDRHDPHYALFLAFLRLLEFGRASVNTLTQRHLDFYYRDILGLKERGAEPGHVHLLAELAKQAASHQFKSGTLFKAGKDGEGRDAFFAGTAVFVANRARVAAVQTVYRHGKEAVGTSALHEGRLYASPVANSDDGLGAPITNVDQSWHPFFNKIYRDGALAEIRMPKAEIGFAVASHYLLLAGGAREVNVGLLATSPAGPFKELFNYADDMRCLLTTEKGWVEKKPNHFSPISSNLLRLRVTLTGDDPPVVPYSAKVHGYSFDTDLPVLMVTLKQDDARLYAYPLLKDLTITTVAVNVEVENLKSLAVSNDFGPVDPSKPFQPFGSSPVKGSSLVVGSREVFQKRFNYLAIKLPWHIPPKVYGKDAPLPTVAIDVLHEGNWVESGESGQNLSVADFLLNDSSAINKAVVDEPDFAANEFYGTQSRHGFVRLKLSDDFNQPEHQADLLKYLRKDTTTDPGPPPVGPSASAVLVEYEATSILPLDTGELDQYENRAGQFFHIAPFGTAEQHPYLSGGSKTHLFPQFAISETQASEAELYIGVADLAPPQNLSLLFQVVDGTANPLAPKPERHVSWSYLENNAWTAFDQSGVQDGTGALLKSGIVTFAVPREATNNNTALQGGLHWIRAAVAENSDAVCRLQLVAAQAMEAAFTDRNNSPEFGAAPLPAGTIGKLVVPDAAVKSVSQPFPSFGGRGVELPEAFYTRVSERLRHKDRAIALWDYEHAILEAFPEIYKVKCLNHTRYETGENVVYRELAPGHVTVVTIPKLHGQTQRDPLKPYTSLGVLQGIKEFLKKRTSCFARLHVENPVFEEVRARFEVRLNAGYDETYYTNLLKQAITRFLSPWAFVDGGTPSFGGRIYKSVLINFVEEQPYVDYVANFQLFHDLPTQKGSVDLSEVEGDKAISILVSVPASKHEITVINPTAEAELAESCSCDS